VGLLVANILIYSEHPTRTIIQAYDEILVPFCMYWLIRAVAPDERDMKRLVAVALVTLAAQTAIGLLSWYAPQVLPSHWLGFGGARTVGSLRNTAVFSSVLLFAGVLLLRSAVGSGSQLRRLGLMALFIVTLYSVFLSFSRGSWLGAALVMVGLIFVYPKTMIRTLLFVTVLVAVLGSTLLSDQLTWGYERLTGLESRNSAQSRVTANDASITMITLKPLFGWGYGNYDEASRPFRRRVAGVEVHDTTSHNTYLTIATELGLIPLLFYMIPVLWWLYWSFKVRRRFPRQGLLGWPVLVSLWLVMLHMFVVTNFMDMIRYYPLGTTVWWLALGLIANIVDGKIQSGEPEIPEETQAAEDGG
jgi:O-antigen ligase